MIPYELKCNTGYNRFLVAINNFSENGWQVPLKNKVAKTVCIERPAH